MAKLSILIPSRCEEWLPQTIENILNNIEEDTEIIVGFDGVWPEQPIDDNPRVRTYYSPEALGQRGMQNQLARLSTAKYVAKTDAHCAFDKGFDRKLIEALDGHDDWTIAPAMKNLHVFNWVCSNCSSEYYQGEKPDKCPDEMCQYIQGEWTKKVYFIPRDHSAFKNNSGPTSTAYRFTPDNLQFKYFGALKGVQDREGGDVVESMSLQGSFFMCTRQKYWELELADESWGGWGQQGTEVALKTWLSGGRVVIHKGIWYAHMFRTNHQVSFPWNNNLKESQGRQQRRARKACVELFKQNKWDKQTRPMSWLIEHFWEPLQLEPSNTDESDRKWSQNDLNELRKTEERFGVTAEPTKGIIYYTAHMKPVKLSSRVQRQLRRISQEFGIPITSVSLKPIPKMGHNLVMKKKPSYMTMFKQIRAAIENSKADILYFCEDDVLYHPCHFDFTPKDSQKFYYNHNFWRIREDGFAVHWDANQVSGLVCYREHALKYYQARVKELEAGGEFNRSYEPGGRDASQYESFWSELPNVDFRPKGTLTKSKWSPDDFRDKSTCVNWQESTINQIPGWEDLSSIL